MLAEYLPTLLFLVVATGIGIALMVIGNLLGPKRPSAEKLSPYECGFEAFEDARMKFDVRYYLIAILFIIFDLEIAFVLPWATVFRSSACSAWSRWACSSACWCSASSTSGRRERSNGSDPVHPEGADRHNPLPEGRSTTSCARTATTR